MKLKKTTLHLVISKKKVFFEFEEYFFVSPKEIIIIQLAVN